MGVCLAGAVQDMLVLAASVRRGGKSLAEIARGELGRTAAVIVSAAILFIVIGPQSMRDLLFSGSPNFKSTPKFIFPGLRPWTKLSVPHF